VLRDGVVLTSGGCAGPLGEGLNSCRDTGTTPTVFHSYQVRYTNGCTQIAVISAGSARDQGATLPGVPQSTNAIDADPCADSGVSVSWTAVPGSGWGDNGADARSYTVLRNSVALSTGGCAGALSDTTTSCIDNTGNNGYSYYYRIMAENLCGQSSNSPRNPGMDRIEHDVVLSTAVNFGRPPTQIDGAVDGEPSAGTQNELYSSTTCGGASPCSTHSTWPLMSTVWQPSLGRFR
jgi:hypothetical protein